MPIPLASFFRVVARNRMLIAITLGGQPRGRHAQQGLRARSPATATFLERSTVDARGAPAAAGSRKGPGGRPLAATH